MISLHHMTDCLLMGIPLHANMTSTCTKLACYITGVKQNSLSAEKPEAIASCQLALAVVTRDLSCVLRTV